jgi:hypothetical protein
MPRPIIPPWRLKHCAVADSLQEAGDRLFTFSNYGWSRCMALRLHSKTGGCGATRKFQSAKRL